MKTLKFQAINDELKDAEMLHRAEKKQKVGWNYRYFVPGEG